MVSVLSKSQRTPVASGGGRKAPRVSDKGCQQVFKGDRCCWEVAGAGPLSVANQALQQGGDDGVHHMKILNQETESEARA